MVNEIQMKHNYIRKSGQITDINKVEATEEIGESKVAEETVVNQVYVRELTKE